MPVTCKGSFILPEMQGKSAEHVSRGLSVSWALCQGLSVDVSHNYIFQAIKSGLRSILLSLYLCVTAGYLTGYFLLCQVFLREVEVKE